MLNWLRMNLLIMSVIFVIGCTKIFINEQYRNPQFNYSMTEGKPVLVVVNKKVIAENYANFVDELNSTNDEFITNFSNILQDSLSYNNLIPMGTKSVLADSLILERNDSIGESGYCIYISDLIISNDEQTEVESGSLGPLTNPISILNCMLKFRVRVFDGSTGKVVMDFESIGEASVDLLMIKTAIAESVLNSINHMTQYLMNDKISFSK